MGPGAWMGAGPGQVGGVSVKPHRVDVPLCHVCTLIKLIFKSPGHDPPSNTGTRAPTLT